MIHAVSVYVITGTYLQSYVMGYDGIWCDVMWLSGEPDYFGRNKISSGGDLSHYSSASLY